MQIIQKLSRVEVGAVHRGALPSIAVAALLAVLAGCGAAADQKPITGTTLQEAQLVMPDPPSPFDDPLPGMPEIGDNGVYGFADTGMLQDAVKDHARLIYVPNSEVAGHTTVIDQRTHKIVRVLQTGQLDQHVTPSWDLKKLYVEASISNRMAIIDPKTGQMAGGIDTVRPYNLYFTPDGKQAIVMDEQSDKIAFADPHTFKRSTEVKDPTCDGPNHMDFSANGRYVILTCEFSDVILKISTLSHKIIGRIRLPRGTKPQDTRLAPDGRSFLVAALGSNELLEIPWDRFEVSKRSPTMSQPHGIYFSRDQKQLYLTARGAGAVQIFDLAKRRFIATWRIPGGSPDMGAISTDGKTLWLSGRFGGDIYGLDTRTGKLVARIDVPGGSPHGLLAWPQPGRYSVGHTGNMR